MMWPRVGDRLIITFLLLVLTLTLSVTGGLSRIDNILYDTAQLHVGRSISDDDVVVVAIDEQSLSALGRWPWSRRLHAQVIDRLLADGARVIGMDVMFTELQQDDAGADHLLAQAMARAGNVVLPVVIEQVRRNGQLIETLPLPELSTQAAALGHVHAQLDEDGIARSMMLWSGVGQAVWPHFAQAMRTVAAQQPDSRLVPPLAGLHDPRPAEVPLLVGHMHRYIDFSTGQQQLPSLSFVQVLRGEFVPGTFRGKWVLVGATASGMADNLHTPVSNLGQPMPGVEFLANALLSLRSDSLITLAPWWLTSMLACAVALLPLWWLPHVRHRTGLVLNVAFAVLLLLSTMALPIFLHYWLPLSAGVLGVLVGYPLWAWRKLESANRFLDAELDRLQRMLGTNATVGTVVGPAIPDRFQRRIEQVQAATEQLHQLEQAHQEALAFVSHDIRVPLASASIQIGKILGKQHPAHKQLTRALYWTEDFLQIARAQMLKADAMTELDLIDLLHQVADDIYPLAQANALRLSLALPTEPVWVLGHFDTLSRAVMNLLSNAVKFSPRGGLVGLSARQEGDQVLVVITDQGLGIPEQADAKLFKRFSRLERPYARNNGGVGLGLYFVQTTMQRHGGRAQMSRREGETAFTLHLPGRIQK